MVTACINLGIFWFIMVCIYNISLIGVYEHLSLSLSLFCAIHHPSFSAAPDDRLLKQYIEHWNWIRESRNLGWVFWLVRFFASGSICDVMFASLEGNQNVLKWRKMKFNKIVESLIMSALIGLRKTPKTPGLSSFFFRNSKFANGVCVCSFQRHRTHYPGPILGISWCSLRVLRYLFSSSTRSLWVLTPSRLRRSLSYGEG